MVKQANAAKKAKEPSKKPTRLEEVLTKFNQLSGNTGRVTLLGSDAYIEDIPVISSGILSFDYALGVGGYPQGRIIEIYGNESSGKTTLTLHALASCQARGGIGAFVDAEHALNVRYANDLGVDTEKLLISQPDSGEEALNVVEHLAKLLGHGDLIVVDSVAALTPQKELDGEMGDSHMGLHARLMSQALRKITGVVSKTGVTVIFINQIRMKLGVMFGNPETTTGGNALKFYATIRIEVRRSGMIKQGDLPVGCNVTLKVVKNKVAPPFRETKPEMRFGEGIPRALDLLNHGVEHGLVEKKGTFYSFNGEKLGQGTTNAYQALKGMPQALEYIEIELRKRFSLKG